MKIGSNGTNFLAFFLVPRPLISSDQMILFYFSVIRDKIGMVRDRYPSLPPWREMGDKVESEIIGFRGDVKYRSMPSRPSYPDPG